MKTFLQCPCGEQLEGADEDALVEVALAHLAQDHPSLHYTREQILFLAY